MIHCFSLSEICIISCNLAAVELENYTADGIIESLKSCLSSLDINKMSGLGTDNASVMSGINNGVYAKLKQIWC